MKHAANDAVDALYRMGYTIRDTAAFIFDAASLPLLLLGWVGRKTLPHTISEVIDCIADLPHELKQYWGAYLWNNIEKVTEEPYFSSIGDDEEDTLEGIRNKVGNYIFMKKDNSNSRGC
jgi:hypothetical protein